MVSAEVVLSAMREMAERRAKKSGERRLARKMEKGWVRKRKEVEHPVAAAEVDETSDSGSSSEDEDFQSALDHLEEVLRALPAREEEEKATTVRVQGTINGITTELLIDTGASVGVNSSKTYFCS